MSVLDASSWHNLSGETVTDVREEVKKTLNTNRYTLHIGSDTNPRSDGTTLITTICFREKEKRKLNPFISVLDRLIHEAVTSLELAEEIRKLTGVRCTIHADVNPSAENLSNRVADAIMGMIKGMGYPVLIKPNAWAADIADMYTR